MLAYLAILGAALAGYTGVAPWVIAAAAIALASISYAEHAPLYDRGRELGLLRLLNFTMLRSFVNGLAACSIAYASGIVLRLI